MTCKDCIHLYGKNICTKGDCRCFVGNMPVDMCGWFEPTDNSVGNALDALETISKSKIVPVNLKIENIIKHEFDFSGIEEIEDSWESVSK